MGDPPPETHLDVAGLDLVVRAQSEDDLALLTKVLGRRQFDPGRASEPLVLTTAPAGPAVPEREPDFAGPYGDHWYGPEGAHFRHHWGLTASVGPNGAVLGGPAEGYRRWVAVRNSMLFVLAHLYLRDRGRPGRRRIEEGAGATPRYLLHAAAIRLDRGGDGPARCALVVGESGQGKSTLTYAAIMAGRQVMADDMVVVQPEGDHVVARGVPRVLTVPSEVLPERAADTEVLPGDDRQRIELEGHVLQPDPARITAVVICGHDSGPGRLLPAAGADALDLLVSAFVLSALPAPLASWFPTAAKLANGPVAELRLACDADRRLRRAAEMLGELESGHQLQRLSPAT